MAFIPELEEDKAGQASSTPTTSTQAAFTGGAGAASAPSSATSTGTGYTNLSKYLDVNQGSGGVVAGAVTSNADKNIGEATSKINNWQAQASKVDKTQTNELEGYKSQVNSDPTKVDANAFRAKVNAGYNAPTQASAVTGYNEAFNAYGNAKDTYQNLAKDDWSSRYSAVKDTFSKDNSNYTKGSGILDTFVAQGDQSGKDAFNNFATKNAGTFAADGNVLSKATTGVQGALDAEHNRWQGLAGADGSIMQDVATKQKSYLDTVLGRQGQADTANATLNKKQDVLSAWAKELATNRGQANAVYKPTATNYTLGDYTSDDERAQLEALSQLGGGDYDRKLVAKSEGSHTPGSLVYNKANGAGQDEWDFDPTTNTMKSRSNFNDSGYTNWLDMKPVGSGSAGCYVAIPMT